VRAALRLPIRQHSAGAVPPRLTLPPRAPPPPGHPRLRAGRADDARGRHQPLRGAALCILRAHAHRPGASHELSTRAPGSRPSENTPTWPLRSGSGRASGAGLPAGPRVSSSEAWLSAPRGVRGVGALVLCHPGACRRTVLLRRGPRAGSYANARPNRAARAPSGVRSVAPCLPQGALHGRAHIAGPQDLQVPVSRPQATRLAQLTWERTLSQQR
jgi:hypothetical protein